ncbi:MAG: sigma 54-interacting transcriptional regulator [Deltaproteobacteria bacterium]|nr:sigma 54-interacting transcriptional regulator [Deltaproteobacteria bacterium]
MALPRIFVIDDSDAVRETLSIVLGNQYEVHELAPSDCTAAFPLPDGKPDLLIINADTAPPALLRATAAGARPVVWLRARPEQGSPAKDAAIPSVVLPRLFDAHSLAEQVQQLLRHPPAPVARLTRDKLSYPYLTEEAARMAREAASSRLPVLISGEPGTGRARVAAAIHALAPGTRLVTITAKTCTRPVLNELANAGDHVTVFLDDVAAISEDAQALLLEVLDAGGLQTQRGWLEIRVIAASSNDLASLAYTGAFSRDLYYRLNVLPITLPPLRDRPHDVPALARAIAADLCSSLACTPVAFSPRATQRLSRYLWFGNTAELEAVLARTISLARKEVIDIGDLLFGFGPLAPSPPPAKAAPAERADPSLGNSTVDLIINELAHEFKNPLVTLKTFAQHLDRLVEEESSRDQLVLLTGDAVDRMDRALENLLQFTRFHEPTPQHVPLGALLGPVLASLGPLLSERRLVLDYRPPHTGLSVHVDPEQLHYAVDNLLRGLTRVIGDGEAIAVTCAEPATVTVRVARGHGKGLGKLAGWLTAREASPEVPLPLGVALARSLIGRNGGHMEMEESAAGLAVTMRLPNAPEMGRGTRPDGATTTADR